jgi:hypothetical protein
MTNVIFYLAWTTFPKERGFTRTPLNSSPETSNGVTKTTTLRIIHSKSHLSTYYSHYSCYLNKNDAFSNLCTLSHRTPYEVGLFSHSKFKTNRKFIMKTSYLINNEQLNFLKSAYFEALASCNECYTEETFSKLCSSEDAYMSFIECSDVRNFG